MRISSQPLSEKAAKRLSRRTQGAEAADDRLPYILAGKRGTLPPRSDTSAATRCELGSQSYFFPLSVTDDQPLPHLHCRISRPAAPRRDDRRHRVGRISYFRLSRA